MSRRQFVAPGGQTHLDYAEAHLDYAALFAATPTPYVVLSTDQVILAVNDAYCHATGRDREELLGRLVFDAFPPNPDDPDADGVVNLRASLEQARDTGQPHTMALQKYDIPDREAGSFVERFCCPVTVPVLGDDGKARWLLHRVKDVTDYVRDRRPVERDEEDWRRRMQEAELDVYARAQAVLAELDRAVRDLAIDAPATVILAKVEQPDQHAERGLRVLRWCNAGHPPPLLLHPDGTAELLRTEADLLLGLAPGTSRTDHERVLVPGATVLLYTDGLIERRGASVDDGLGWLVEAAAGRGGLVLEEVVRRSPRHAAGCRRGRHCAARNSRPSRLPAAPGRGRSADPAHLSCAPIPRSG